MQSLYNGYVFANKFATFDWCNKLCEYSSRTVRELVMRHSHALVGNHSRAYRHASFANSRDFFSATYRTAFAMVRKNPSYRHTEHTQIYKPTNVWLCACAPRNNCKLLLYALIVTQAIEMFLHTQPYLYAQICYRTLTCKAASIFQFGFSQVLVADTFHCMHVLQFNYPQELLPVRQHFPIWFLPDVRC